MLHKPPQLKPACLSAVVGVVLLDEAKAPQQLRIAQLAIVVDHLGSRRNGLCSHHHRSRVHQPSMCTLWKGQVRDVCQLGSALDPLQLQSVTRCLQIRKFKWKNCTRGDHLQALGVLVVVQPHVAAPRDVVQRVPQRHHGLQRRSGTTLHMFISCEKPR